MPSGCGRLGGVLVAIGCTLGGPAMALDTETLRGAFLRVQESAPVERFEAWRALVDRAHAMPVNLRLVVVNDFVNGRVRYAEDREIWGRSEYWATPMETLARGAGDCEDYAIAKYFSLVQAGVPAASLRLVYARARDAVAPPEGRPHVVLAYYRTPEADPLLLDSLVPEIRYARQRPDLALLFSFNEDGIYSIEPRKGLRTGVDRFTRWADVLARARLEGFGGPLPPTQVARLPDQREPDRASSR